MMKNETAFPHGIEAPVGPLLFCHVPGYAIDDRGNVIFWNDKCVELTGVAAKDILGRPPQWKLFFEGAGELLAHRICRELGGRNPENGESSPRLMWNIFRSNSSLPITRLMFCVAGTLAIQYGAWECLFPVGHDTMMFGAPIIKAIIDQLPDAVMVGLNGKILCLNEEAMKLHSLRSPEQAHGKPVSLFVDNWDMPAFIKFNDECLRSRRKKWTRCWRSKIGAEDRIMEVAVRSFYFDRDQVAFCTIKDVTADKAALRKLSAEKRRLVSERMRLLHHIAAQSDFFIGNSPAMKKAVSRVGHFAQSDVNVVILGETGTGKSVLARLLHDLSRRAGKPFVEVNCAAIPETLMESEFFGHRKGSFTGASENHKGFFAQAQGGTLFLDEIGELSPVMQAKLLHAVENKKYRRVGAETDIKVDIRIICATNHNLQEMLQVGKLREDFYYRILEGDIMLPPLRERKSDLNELIDFIFARITDPETRTSLPARIRRAMLAHSWPGNVREMKNVLSRFIYIGELRLADTQETSVYSPACETETAVKDSELDLKTHLRNEEARWIKHVLALHGGRKDRAAAALGMNIRTFHRRCRELGI